MKIAALRLHNVKRFAGRGVAIEGIGDGVNVLCAANEEGKSTSFEALHALFFQPHTGVPRDVRRMQPYSGGNPLVEADVVTGTGRFRLTKQFIGGRRASVVDLDSGRLVAQADEAENFIAGLVRGGSAGPAGLLWVRQGVTGLEARDRREEEGERRVRETLLASVQGEVEAITGGRRMAEILEACNDELGALVTPSGRPRSGGAYDAAIEELKRRTEEEGRLDAEVTALRNALDERGRVLKRLGEVEDADEKAARGAALEAAEAAFEVAKAHGEALRTAEAEMALARSRRDAAQRDLDAFRTAMDEAETLRGVLRSARTGREEALARRDAAAAALEKAMAEVQAAEGEELAARDHLARLDAALTAGRAAEELAGLQDRLDQAEAARGELEKGEAELALIALPAEAVERLQALEIEIVGLRAARDAGLPTLRIAYDEGADARVTMDGMPLPDAEERAFEDLARLGIPGVGTLTLRSNRAAGADGILTEAERKRKELLAALGVESLAEARDQQAEAQVKSSELERLRSELGHLAPEGLARLREEVTRRGTLASVMPESEGDPDEARLGLAEAGRKVSDARNGVRELQPLRSRADDALVAAERAWAGLDAERARLDAALGPEPERAGKQQALSATLTGQQGLLEPLEARAAELRRAAPDLESAEAALRRARSVEDAAAQEAATLRERLAELNGQIRTRSDDAVEEAWREASEARTAAAERVTRFETEVAALGRLRDALQASRSAARDLYLGPVIAELRPLLGLLFDDVSIVFDERTLLPQAIRRNGQEEEVDRLSGGMREQLSVLTRLAFARLLARDGQSAPVILDDALVYSDDDRIERMFDALHRQSRDQQIIVFSCRQRAFSRLGGNVLQMTEWHPDSA